MANEENNFENDEVSRLLGSMKRVDVPRDFDFRVRARIASGKPSVRSTWLPVPVRMAAGLMVVLAAGYLGFRSYSSPAANQASLAPAAVSDQRPAESSTQPVSREVVSQTNMQPAESASRPRDADNGTVASTKLPEIGQPEAPKEETGGGSIDFSSRESNPILPRGFNQNTKIPANVGGLQQEAISVSEALRELGIDAASEASGWRVTSVSGMAARAGIKVGDVIQAFGGRSLVGRSSLSGGVSGNTFVVRREGKVILIKL